MGDWVDEKDVDPVLEEDSMVILWATGLVGLTGARAVSRWLSSASAAETAYNRVKHGVPLKEAPRVLIDLVLKETSC